MIFIHLRFPFFNLFGYINMLIEILLESSDKSVEPTYSHLLCLDLFDFTIVHYFLTNPLRYNALLVFIRARFRTIVSIYYFILKNNKQIVYIEAHESLTKY